MSRDIKKILIFLIIFGRVLSAPEWGYTLHPNGAIQNKDTPMWEKFQGLVEDNPEAKEALGKIKADYDSKVTAVESLTQQFETAKQMADDYKKGNQLVKQAFGLEKINDDTVKERLEALSGNNDGANDELVATIQTLKKELGSKDEAIKQAESEYNSKMTDFMIQIEIDKGINAVSDRLVDDGFIRNAFRAEVSKGIGKVGDIIAPFEQVGDSRIPIKDGDKVMGVDAYMTKLLDSDQFASLRKPTVKQSAGETGGGGKPKDKPLSEMSAKEKFEHFEAQTQG